jgi:putative MATE family efflux protein
MSSLLRATLTEGSVGKHLYTMALPMVWGLLATMSFNAVDTFFVAKLGDLELAAMSFTFPVVMFVTSIAIGLGAGTSSAVSRAIGSGNQVLARRLATDSMSLSALISVAVSLIGWLTIEPLFLFLGASQELIKPIQEYMSIWYFSAPFLMVPMVTLASLRAMGLSSVQGYLMGGAAIFNAILDPLLIFGWYGFPRMELQGAALATLITRSITLLVAFYILNNRMHMLVNPFTVWHSLKRSWLMIFAVGMPAMFTNIVIPLSSGVVVALVAQHGTAAVAGLGVAVRIEPLALIVFYALSGVVGPFFGQNLGAGKHQRLLHALRIITSFNCGFGLVLAIVFWVVAGEIAGLFSDSPEVLSIAVSYLFFVPISYGAYGLVMAVNAAFNGMGCPRPPMVISFLRVFGIYLPLAFVGQWIWGMEGLFIATCAANLLLGLLAYYWIKKHLLEL